jgi:hypothetical protein
MFNDGFPNTDVVWYQWNWLQWQKEKRSKTLLTKATGEKINIFYLYVVTVKLLRNNESSVKAVYRCGKWY